MNKIKLLLFDDVLKTRSGKKIPYYHEQTTGNDDDSDITHLSEHWFHEGYGRFQCYRLHETDEDERYIYYICEPLHKFKSTSV